VITFRRNRKHFSIMSVVLNNLKTGYYFMFHRTVVNYLIWEMMFRIGPFLDKRFRRAWSVRLNFLVANLLFKQFRTFFKTRNLIKFFKDIRRSAHVGINVSKKQRICWAMLWDRCMSENMVVKRKRRSC